MISGASALGYDVLHCNDSIVYLYCNTIHMFDRQILRQF
jgi:hypothetical protein